MFSLPLIIIFVDKKNLRQIADQWPIIFPPNITIFLGRNKDGRKMIQTKIIPEKKKIENKKFLII